MIKSVIDQLGDPITFNFPPRRIISLVPSQTELLADLGLETEVVGITKFCVHPPLWSKSKTIIGGTKNFRFDVIDELAPDLIIGNKEENYREGIVKLKEQYPVWMSDIVSYEDALAMVEAIGVLTDRENNAHHINSQIVGAFRALRPRESCSALYMIWRRPWMAAGGHTFINTMMEMMGLKNCIADQLRYPELSSDEIRAYAPELIFLSSEPYPFREEHVQELQKILPSSKIILVDGEMFSWYGSRLALAPQYFNTLILVSYEL